MTAHEFVPHGTIAQTAETMSCWLPPGLIVPAVGLTVTYGHDGLADQGMGVQSEPFVRATESAVGPF